MTGQGWIQLGELMLAFALSALVGVERQIRQKSAGLRTHCLVGMASALVMLISKYGFDDVLGRQLVVLDPSRMAAQVVSGIGFIGGGVIFMHRDVVRGLTTAASIWLTAALGMACGAGLVVLATATTIGHFVIMLGFPVLERRLPRTKRSDTRLRIRYDDGHGLLQTILVTCTRLRFAVHHVTFEGSGDLLAPPQEANDPADDQGVAIDRRHARGAVTLVVKLSGKRPISDLITRLSDIGGVDEVGMVDEELALE